MKSQPFSWRPLSLGQILDRAIVLYRRHFWLFIGIVAVVLVPATILQAVFKNLLVNSNSLNGTLRELIVFRPWLEVEYLPSIILFMVIPLAAAPLSLAVLQAHLGRQPVLRQVYNLILHRFSHLLLTILLTTVIGGFIVVWNLLVPFLGVFLGLGPTLFYFTAIVGLVGPIFALEQQSGYEALRRAWDVSRTRLWWVLGTMLVLFLLLSALLLGPITLVEWIGAMLPKIGLSNVLFSQVADLIGLLLVALLAFPLYISTLTIVYLDLRIRAEGLDLLLNINQMLTQPEEVTAILTRVPSAVETMKGGKLTDLIFRLPVVLLAIVIVLWFFLILIGWAFS